jgi:hypothetical protein
MGRIWRKASDPARARFFLLAPVVFAFVSVFLVLPGLPASSAVRIEYSPAYAVYVRLAYTSPFVPDGRSTFAVFDLEAVFRKVQFTRSAVPAASPGGNFSVAQPGSAGPGSKVHGQGNLSGFRLNLVDDGTGPKLPRITEGPKPFDVALALAGAILGPEWNLAQGPIGEPKDPEDAGEQVPLVFETFFGLHTLRWEYQNGHAYLENERLIFLIPWNRLMAGRDFTFKTPYKGCFEEDDGTWEFRFVPESSLK